jgi:serine/threonine-protein kinase RsbW
VGRTSAGTSGDCRLAELPSTAGSVPVARHLVRDDLAARNLPARVIEDSMLVVSELMSNAVRHARPLRGRARAAVRLRWAASPRRVWIAVTDGGGGRHRPHVESTEVTDLGGRGLAIVQAVANDWGVSRAGTEVTVYAVLTG